MKKLLQVLCSCFFATALSAPVDAQATPVEDCNDTAVEQSAESSEAVNYHMALVMSDFGPQRDNAGMTNDSGRPVIFVSDPTGKMIKDAQVVTTIIGSNDRQVMCRALPFFSGYLIPTNHLVSGQYRVEAEIVTNGWLLTEEFNFAKI